MRACAFSALLLVTVLAAACSKDEATTTTASTTTSPTTSTFASRLTPTGAVSRSFTATKSGTVTVTLTAAGAPSTRVGLGIGVPTSGIARCSLSSAITTVAGPAPQIVASVDAGDYCVAVYDVGSLAGEITFDLTIVYP